MRRVGSFAIALAACAGPFPVGCAAPIAEPARPFAISMSGSPEISLGFPPTGQAGDPDGRGTVTVTLDAGQRRVCYEINVTAVEPLTMAHIHRGGPRENGPAVVTFFEVTVPGSAPSSGCVDGVSQRLIRRILSDPEGFYVHVHNVGYPAGALRGQLATRQ